MGGVPDGVVEGGREEDDGSESGWDWEGEGGGRDAILSDASFTSPRARKSMTPHSTGEVPSAEKFDDWGSSLDLCSGAENKFSTPWSLCALVVEQFEENELATICPLCADAF